MGESPDTQKVSVAERSAVVGFLDDPALLLAAAASPDRGSTIFAPSLLLVDSFAAGLVDPTSRDTDEYANTAGAVPTSIQIEIERRIAEGDLDLPMLPSVALEVMQLCRKSSADARAIATVMLRDQSIAGNVMRVANSPLGGAREKITSLQQAVGRLGMSQLTEVVVAVTMQARMFEVPIAWQSLVGDLQLNSLLAALWAKEIARAARSNVESAFLLGLLHDMGKPVVLATARDVQQRDGIKFSAEEIAAALLENHAEIGAHLAAAWDLPESTSESIRRQEDWLESEPPNAGAALIELATRLTHLTNDFGEFDETMVGAEDAAATLELYRSDIDDLCALRERVLGIAQAMR